MKIDKELPFHILAKVAGFEIMGALVNLTYYGENILFSVSNGDFAIHEHEQVEWRITEI